VRRILSAAVIALASSAAQAQTAASLNAPRDEVLLRLSATGVQIYECRTAAGAEAAWVFKEPRAQLFVGGKPIGRHFAGPSWEHLDGSRITGKVVSSVAAPQPGDIPWLRLAVASHAGEGAFSTATAVQRLNTKGGVLAGACSQPGAVSEVPYTADYVILREAP
jgi:hypothetical protein